MGPKVTDRLSGRVRELCFRDDGVTPVDWRHWSGLPLGKFLTLVA